MNQEAKSTLFEKMGGWPTLRELVEQAYDRCSRDVQLGPIVRNSFLPGLTAEMKVLSAHLLGAFSTYGGSRGGVHSTLVNKGLSQRHFRTMLGYFRAVLVERGTDSLLTEQVISELDKARFWIFEEAA